tara:strand:+ start:1228 stop:1632 length:405 start_codon:yes stop_codon:yes gene_type:complete
MIINKLLQIALKSSAGDLAKKYTGKTLTNILKSISKNKSNLEGQGIKIAPLKRKVAGAKNKRKDFVTEQDAENRYGTIAQGARKGGKEVPLTNRKKGGMMKSKYMSKGGAITKRKSGGMIGGSQFVASLYKEDK